MNKIQQIGIIGAGIMGSGIAKAVLRQDINVKLFDIDTSVLDQAVERIKNRALRWMDPEKLKKAESPEDLLEGTDLLIEAVVENPDIKSKLFNELGRIAPAETIFTSNTSSLSITSMARASGRPGNFAGLHFFNPPTVMRLVEFTVTEELSPVARARIEEFLIDIKKTGVQCCDSPGFIVNRLLIPVINETFHLLEQRSGGREELIIETANDMDSAVLKENLLPMGPCDLADLTGLDTICRVGQVVYRGFGNNPRYSPSGLLCRLADKGYYGRKAGRGIYRYENNRNDPDMNPPRDAAGDQVVRVESPEFRVIELAAVMVNEAFRILEEGIAASPEDIDLCTDIGTRWPRGPFRIVKDEGSEKFYRILKQKYNETGEPRYEPSGLFQEPTEALNKYIEEE